MKKILILILTLLLLGGCAANEQTETAEPTQATPLNEQGVVWDREGALHEIFLNLPAGQQFAESLPFEDDLLVWSIDDHLLDEFCLELCLISLDDGSVIAKRDVRIENYATPQSLGEHIYICDNYSGTVLELDKNLNEVARWNLDPGEYTWYYGAGGKIYQMKEDSKLWVYHLEDGRFEPVLSGDPYVNCSGPDGSVLSMEYYHPETGIATYAALDLLTGDVIQPEDAARYGYIHTSGGSWISGRTGKPFSYRFCTENGIPVQFDTDGYYVDLLPEGRFLLTSEDNQYLHLFDLNGEPVSACRISETGVCWFTDLIWNEAQNGYYLVIYSYDNTCRLLFWDITQPPQLDKLLFEPIPEPSAEEAALLRRCEEIGAEYGVSVLIGEACETSYIDFIAQVETDWIKVREELDTLEQALDAYPDGFFQQFRRKSPQGVQIMLVRDIVPVAGGQFAGDYEAFVEYRWDSSAVVVDIEESGAWTYYHEFSHVIDDFLEWDSWQRDDALFSEEAWNLLNPDWFEGYTYDYGFEAELMNYTYFVDSYATINPTEDRARVLEYGMSEYGLWTFEDAPGLLNKLDYYSRCIRDAFDTDGWPEVVRWEQYLNQGIG